MSVCLASLDSDDCFLIMLVDSRKLTATVTVPSLSKLARIVHLLPQPGPAVLHRSYLQKELAESNTYNIILL